MAEGKATSPYKGTQYINTYPRNDDLFYDAQMASNKLTWRLKTCDDKPVLKGPLSDADTGLSYTVGHEYSGANSGVLGGVSDIANKVMTGARDYDMVRRSMQKYVGKDSWATNLISGVTDTVDGAISDVGKWIADKTGMSEETRKGIGNLIRRTQDLAYGKFVSAFDFIKIFQGTSIDITLPTLEVTLLDYNDNPLNEQVDAINDVFLGNLTGIDDVTKGKVAKVGLFGVQEAPNGYKPHFDGLDSITEFDGTFKLLLGDKYAITDLVITGYQVNQSQYTRKGSINPLYADVSIQLTFASYVTKEKLKNYLKRQ